MVELQIHIREFAVIKQKAHVAYESARRYGLVGDPLEGLVVETNLSKDSQSVTLRVITGTIRWCASIGAFALGCSTFYYQRNLSYDKYSSRVPSVFWAVAFAFPLLLVAFMLLRRHLRQCNFPAAVVSTVSFIGCTVGVSLYLADVRGGAESLYVLWFLIYAIPGEDVKEGRFC